MLGTYLQLTTPAETFSIFFVPGTEYEEKAPRDWGPAQIDAHEFLEGAGIFANGLAQLKFLPDLPLGEFLQLPGAVADMVRARRLVSAWIAAISYVRHP